MTPLKHRLKSYIQNFYLSIILLFLYVPMFTLIVLSFNSSKSRTQWGGFTLQWYAQILKDHAIMDALYNTLLIAFVSALIATMIGTAACIGIDNMKKMPRSIILGVANIPMLNAEIVTGISLMLVYIAFGISLGFKTILISHITFNIPYVILSVMPKLKQTSKTTYEAAMDLGAGPVHAFFKVVFPDILPGVLSGFLLAFTMSLDDFIITHFTKGAGINTLSTLIYSEVRRGIQPTMYALSTIIFVTVITVLLVTNFFPKKAQEAKIRMAGHTQANKIKKRKLSPIICAVLTVIIVITAFLGYQIGVTGKKHPAGEVLVYNWGEYIDPDVITMFEEETGIKVIYDMFETNEEMYPVIEAGGVSYDVVCPSDYMIQKMAENNLLAELNYDNIPNIKEIDPERLKDSQSFDPLNKYSVPYCWGTVGILYNTSKIAPENAPNSWLDLWNPELEGEILMQDSVRDAFIPPLKALGYSINTTDRKELEQARDMLLEQKPLVQAYVIDQVRDKMIGGEAAIAIIYSGEMLYIQSEVEKLGLDYELKYVIPKEGTNVWIDSWVIPANAKNKENAEQWINFLARPDIAKMNFEYITYATPNKGAFELLDPEIQNNKALFPDEHEIQNSELFKYLGNEADSMYNEYWKEVKSK